MFKFIILAVLAACVAAGTFTPTELDCDFQFTWTTSDDKAAVYYGFQTDNVFILKEERPHQGDTKEITLYRSDMRSDEGIYFQNGVPGKSCQDEYIPLDDAKAELKGIVSAFDYSQGPTDIDCPNTTLTGCKQYCNDENECVIVDEHGRYVKLADSSVVDYVENAFHTVDEFGGVTCDGDDIPLPSYSCGEPQTYSPPGLDCAFHFTVTDTSDKEVVYYGFQTDSVFILKEERPHQGDTKEITLYRSDMKEGDDIYFQNGVPGKSCQNEYVPLEAAKYEVKDIVGPFQYNQGPTDIACPNTTFTGCLQYCLKSKCVIIDDRGRYVKLADSSVVAYENVVHTVDEFGGETCEGAAIAPPENPCGAPQPSSTAPTSSVQPKPSSGAASALKAVLAVVAATLAISLM